MRQLVVRWKMLIEKNTKPLIAFTAIFFLISCVNVETGSEESSSSSSSSSSIPEYAPYVVTVVCVAANVGTICQDNGTAEGKKIYVAYIKDACSSFGSSTTITTRSDGTTTADFSSPNQQGTVQVSEYLKQTIDEGSYNIVAFIDLDNDTGSSAGIPESGDPYICSEGYQISSSTGGTAATINITSTK